MGANDDFLSNFDREFLADVSITTSQKPEFPDCPMCGRVLDLYHRLNHCQNWLT
jgi:hypothetical protein